MATNVKAKPGARASAQTAPARRARSAEAKDNVRQALIDAGRDLLLATPSIPISLRGIARHAGYSSGVIYRYFADRDALFLAIRDSEMTNFIDGLEADFTQTQDPRTRLLAIAERAFDFSRYQIAAFGMNSLFLFWLNRSDLEGGEALVHDPAPAAARIHAFFEDAVRSVIPSDAQEVLDFQVAVGALMASITGAVLLPGGSDHDAFPDGRHVMRETIEALISRWRRPPSS